MTVDQLIAALSALPEDQRKLEVRAWMPGTQIALTDVKPFLFKLNVCGRPLPQPVVLVEGNVADSA